MAVKLHWFETVQRHPLLPDVGWLSCTAIGAVLSCLLRARGSASDSQSDGRSTVWRERPVRLVAALRPGLTLPCMWTRIAAVMCFAAAAFDVLSRRADLDPLRFVAAAFSLVAGLLLVGRPWTADRPSSV